MSHSQLHGTVTNEERASCMEPLVVKKASVKRHRFPFLNDISDLVLGCFYNLVIKPPDKL
jgi:hypothetical protein